MPLSVATKIADNGTTDIEVAMALDNNGQAITVNKDLSSAGVREPRGSPRGAGGQVADAPDGRQPAVAVAG
jgi:hypothetical protein